MDGGQPCRIGTIEILMSVYAKERPEFLRAALESMRVQTRPADAWLIVEDGPLGPELEAVLAEAEQRIPNFRRLKLAENRGLGLALRAGMEAATGDWIARMDSDDLSNPERLALEEAFLLAHPEVDLVGAQILEFDQDPKRPLASRLVPLDPDEIARYQRRRSAVNHVSVLMRREAVLAAGNYEDALYMEDDMLWLNMLQHGCRLANVPEPLVLVRVGDGMFERRGGQRYLACYHRARRTAWQRGQISFWDYWLTMAAQLFMTYCPASWRRWIFVRLLRSRPEGA